MNFVLKPSLEHMALLKITISLWNLNDVSGLISKLCPNDLCSRAKWKAIEERVIKKVPLLSLPQLLKEKVFDFVKPIGLEIFKWIRLHYRYLRAHLPAEFCWTPYGTIDRKGTAEVLVRGENLDVSTCYELACVYCLEDEIQKFLNMPQDLKESDWCKSKIVSFWSRYIKRKDFRNPHIKCRTSNLFFRSVYHGHKVAAEYFLQKLTPRKRKESLVNTAKQATMYADVLCFLLEETDEEQQMEVFKHNSYNVLRCFLEWPWQSFFIKVANHMWDFLPEVDYNLLMMDIVYKVIDGYKDCNYQDLFIEFWEKSPNALKSCIDEDNAWILHKIKNKENIRLILKDATLYSKTKNFFTVMNSIII